MFIFNGVPFSMEGDASQRIPLLIERSAIKDFMIVPMKQLGKSFCKPAQGDLLVINTKN